MNTGFIMWLNMKVKIHYSMYIFLLISLIFGFTKQLILMIFVLMLHELGHLFFLKQFKREIVSLTVFPFGGIITHSNSCNEENHQELLISSGGIIINIIILLISYLLNLEMLMLVDILILMFNILPIYPLDGGKILKVLFGTFFSYNITIKINLFISFTAICTLFVVNTIYIKSIYITLLCFTLLKLNYDYLISIKKEYQIFLTNKYLYPNNELKEKKVHHFKLPINKLYLGKNVVFILEELEIKEYDVLRKHFS